jgi:hypothetical protein
MLAKMQRKGNSYTLWVGMLISRNILESNIAVPQKTKNKTII